MNVHRRSISLYDLALIYIIMWLMAPPLAYGTIYRVLFIGAICLIAAKILSYEGKYFSNIILAIISLIGLFSLLNILNGISLTRNFGEYIFMLCAAFVVPFFCMSPNVSRYRYLIIFTFLLCIIFNCTTIQGIALNSNVMRDLAKNSDFSRTYARMGIGGYGYCYSVVLLIPMAFEYIFDRKQSFFNRMVSLGFLLSTYYMVFASAYFLAIIISVICVPLYLSLKISNPRIKYLMIVLLVIVAGILYINLESIVNVITQNMEPGTIKRKLFEIVNISQAESTVADGEFGTRYKRYMKDIKYLVTSPLWGTLDRDNGNHSYILDIFASYGAIIGVFYFSYLKKVLNLFGYKEMSAVRTIVVLAVFFMLMNSLAPGIAVALFIISPIYCLSQREALSYE